MEGSGLGASRLDHSYVSSYWIIHIWIYLRGFLKMVLLSNHAYNKTSSVLSIPETHGFGDSHFEKPTKSEFGLRPCTHHSCYPPLLLTKHIQVISICPSCRHIYIYLFIRFYLHSFAILWGLPVTISQCVKFGWLLSSSPFRSWYRLRRFDSWVVRDTNVQTRSGPSPS